MNRWCTDAECLRFDCSTCIAGNALESRVEMLERAIDVLPSVSGDRGLETGVAQREVGASGREDEAQHAEVFTPPTADEHRPFRPEDAGSTPAPSLEPTIPRSSDAETIEVEHARLRVGMETILWHASGECRHTADQHMQCFEVIETIAKTVRSPLPRPNEAKREIPFACPVCSQPIKPYDHGKCAQCGWSDGREPRTGQATNPTDPLPTIFKDQAVEIRQTPEFQYLAVLLIMQRESIEATMGARTDKAEPEYGEGGWLRQGDLAVCPECKSVLEGTISWNLAHEKSCAWKPAGTWFATRLKNELAQRSETAHPVMVARESARTERDLLRELAALLLARSASGATQYLDDGLRIVAVIRTRATETGSGE